MTIAAIATPLAAGGISIIRISGEQAIEIADRVFQAQSGVPLAQKAGYTAAFGQIIQDGKPLDTSVATVFRAPKSYTGEDVVELSCHGGVMITREVLRVVLEQGAALAEPGEFTKRAFLNGKLNLTQAEAVADLIQAGNRQAMNCRAFRGLGGLSRGGNPGGGSGASVGFPPAFHTGISPADPLLRYREAGSGRD